MVFFLLPTKKIVKFSKIVIQIVTLILDYCFTRSLIQLLLISLMFLVLSHHTTCLSDTIWKSRYTVANEGNGYSIKTVKYKSYYEK